MGSNPSHRELVFLLAFFLFLHSFSSFSLPWFHSDSGVSRVAPLDPLWDQLLAMEKALEINLSLPEKIFMKKILAVLCVGQQHKYMCDV